MKYAKSRRLEAWVLCATRLSFYGLPPARVTSGVSAHRHSCVPLLWGCVSDYSQDAT